MMVIACLYSWYTTQHSLLSPKLYLVMALTSDRETGKGSTMSRSLSRAGETNIAGPPKKGAAKQLNIDEGRTWRTNCKKWSYILFSEM